MLDILFIQNTVVHEIIVIFGSSKSELFSESKPFWPCQFSGLSLRNDLLAE